MKDNKKKAARVNQKPSQDPRNPRKGRKKGGKAGKIGSSKAARTARSRQVREAALTEVGGERAWTDRVVDTIELLYRRGQIDADQRQAAGLYLEAWELIQGGVACALDVERVRGSGIASPTESQLLASRRLAEAGRLLGRLDEQLVALVVCEGHSIQEAAGLLLGVAEGGRPSRADAEHIGARLRLALLVLAEAWIFGRAQSRAPLRGTRAAGAEGVTPGETGRRQVERGRVVHATGRKIYEV